MRSNDMPKRLPVLLIGLVSAAIAASPSRAQTYQVLHTFTGTNGDGAEPRGALIQVGSDFYGTTSSGGDATALCSGGCGTVFKLDSSGSVTTVYSFDASTDDAILPRAGLVLGPDGSLYGTSPAGGVLNDGAVYRFDLGTGLATTIYSADRTGGGWFVGPPVTAGSDGMLYVATTYGHCGDGTANCPQLLRMTTAGAATPLHTFAPEEGGILLSPLLEVGATDFDGTWNSGDGGVFRLNGAGEIIPLHVFIEDPNGRGPVGTLLRDAAGNLYGVTAFGGASEHGTIFRIDANGEFASLHSFDGTDGSFPASGLIQASDGLFYGTTELGGAFGFGTLYRMDAQGVVVKLHDFDGTSGARPVSPESPEGSLDPTASLVEGSDGSLYGVRFQGGDAGKGILFRLTPQPPAPLFCPNAFVRRDQMAVFLLKTEHGSAHLPPSCVGAFPDVACPGLFADWIEELASEGITAGCGGGHYCPLSPVTREQMAVFLLKTEHGTSFTPPACTGVFTDVPCSSPFAPWIETLASEGVTGGCGAGIFCPGNPVTRAQMAVFLLKIEHGGSYSPPACTPLFADVACPSLFADWIEQLFAEGITAGCS
jgi:uncharacterized repeat protein (TIGR03803 family)